MRKWNEWEYGETNTKGRVNGRVGRGVLRYLSARSRLTLERGIRFSLLLSFLNRTQEHDFITRQTQNDSCAEQTHKRRQAARAPLNPALQWPHTQPAPPPNTHAVSWSVPLSPGCKMLIREQKVTVVLKARRHCKTYCCMHEKTRLSIPCSVMM